MELVERILRHPAYNEYLHLNAESEKDRQFCIHDLQHALDVARIAYIIALERKLDINKEIIYITALLHDIGRWKQYRAGLDHALEGAFLAEEILHDIGVPDQAAELILAAIKGHRRKSKSSNNTISSNNIKNSNNIINSNSENEVNNQKKTDRGSVLGDIICESDKACRFCINCGKLDECNWYTDGSRPVFKY